MKKDNWFVLVIGLATLALFFVPTGFENSLLVKDIQYVRATILSVDNTGLDNYSIVTTGEQKLTVRIDQGTFTKDTLEATNILLGQKRIDKMFVPGDRALTVLRLDPSHKKILEVRASDYYRQDLEWMLFACFALFLVAFSRFIGLKALLSFVFTALSFWKVLIPFYLRGYPPLLVAMGIVLTCTVVITLLVAGLNRKGLVALLGTTTGIIFTALMAIGFGYYFKIPGTSQEFSESLLYTGFMNLNLSEIFISVIFISSAGAVMDVSMDIAAALDEISHRLPNLSQMELMKSGFRIASPIIGSMTTTLLFAYSGSFMFAFMAFMAKGTPLTCIVNLNYISAEILHTLVGSFGLVLVAPLTAIIGSILYTYRKN